MKIAIIYYSRTGNTKLVVDYLKNILTNNGFIIDTYFIQPIREYSKPLHLNPRLIYDTLIKKGTSITIKPREFSENEYSILIIASPIWAMKLSSPIQEFLKRYIINKPVLLLITSSLKLNCNKVLENIVKKYSLKITRCFNIDKNTINNYSKLENVLKEITSTIKNIAEKSEN